MKKFYLISIFLCVAFIQNNQAQSVFLKKADSCFLNKYFDLAQLYYARSAFEEHNPNKQTFILFKQAEALLLDNKKAEAVKVINAIALSEIEDSLRVEVLFKSALYEYFNQNYIDAKSKLKLLEDIYIDKKYLPEVKLLNIFILNEEGKYLEAREMLLSYIRNDQRKTEDEKLLLLKQADSVYTFKNMPHIINKNRTTTLNALTLGFGFFYAHYYLEGIGSLLMQSAGLGLSTISIINGYYATGIVVPMSLYNYFHTGSVKRVEYLVEKDNYKKIKLFNSTNKQKIINLVK